MKKRGSGEGGLLFGVYGARVSSSFGASERSAPLGLGVHLDGKGGGVRVLGLGV